MKNSDTEQWNIASGDDSTAIGQRNSVYGHHSILIGEDLTTSKDYQLIIQVGDTNINEIMTEREHYLVSSALNSASYLRNIDLRTDNDLHQ